MARRKIVPRTRFYFSFGIDSNEWDGQVASTLYGLVRKLHSVCGSGVEFIRGLFPKTYTGEVYEISFTDVKIRKVK